MIAMTVGCDQGVDAPGPGKKSDPSKTPVTWLDVTDKVGILNDDTTWPDGHFHAPEITGSGVALFDYDNDGDLDVYQICHPPPGPWPDALNVPAPNRLYQQQADGQFKLMPMNVGLNDAGYGQGVATGDVDNDGDIDVFVTNVGPDRLFLNQGNGTFTDHTSNAGLSRGTTSDEWSTAAAFFDYDRDGHLDLFVVRYLKYDPTVKCGENETRHYCNPIRFASAADSLYHNNGNGTFTDVTKDAGINNSGRGLGVVCVDLNDDDWVDIYVANDVMANQLWINKHDGTFREIASIAGVALNGMGQPEASMGIAVGDLTGTGKLDIFLTHEAHETNTLYRAESANRFRDRSATSGVARDSMGYAGWGCALFDGDLDLDLDLAVVNGMTNARAGENTGAFWLRFAQPNLFFVNDGNGRMVLNETGGAAFVSSPGNTRGLAIGDIDGDGDVDMVTNDISNQLRIFRNDLDRTDRHWLAVRAMVGTRDALGAKLTLHNKGHSLVRVVLPAQSYLSSSDPRVHFGLGNLQAVDSLKVTWPDGNAEEFAVSGVDQLIVIHQGKGTPIKKPSP